MPSSLSALSSGIFQACTDSRLSARSSASYTLTHATHWSGTPGLVDGTLCAPRPKQSGQKTQAPR